MPTYVTPGVYFERPDPRERPSPQRTDVAGFIGLAERGPLHEPVRLTNWRQFQQVFGGFLFYAQLAYAVRAFFENGGRACWVVRVADNDAARASSAKVPDSNGMRAYFAVAANPGTWGDRLAVSVQPAHLAASRHQAMNLPDDFLAVASISGFEVGSRVRLTQALGEPPIQVTRRVIEVDAIRGLLRFDMPLSGAGLKPDLAENPISVESLEFILLVTDDDQVVERFANLAPDPAHSRFAVEVVNDSSRLIRLEAGDGDTLPHLPWRGALGRGANGLRTLNIFDYVGTPQGDVYGLAALANVEEVSLLVMPDLTLRPQPPPPSQRAPRRKIDECALDTPTLRVDIKGRVVDAETGQGLREVRVAANDRIRIYMTETDANGDFSLLGLLPGDIELVFNLEGYEERVYPVGGTTEVGEVLLTPLDLPPPLNDADIYYGQAAMVAQCEQLRDRFALIDPPLDANGNLRDISGLQSWRARFDTPFAALYYPWLIVHDPLQPAAPQGRLVSPSGHVAGVYAATDLSEGVFRPPANRALAFVDDVGIPIDDALQGMLNPQGINVIRAFPGRGIRVYGARTLSSDTAWRFVNVRRLISMLEEALYDSLQWAVFEPNNIQLWFGLHLAITTLVDGLWRRGAFAGDTPDAAYQVRCDATTTPPEAQAEGQVIAEVSVAPTVPYEFIILRLGLTADELQVSEV